MKREPNEAISGSRMALGCDLVLAAMVLASTLWVVRPLAESTRPSPPWHVRQQASAIGGLPQLIVDANNRLHIGERSFDDIAGAREELQQWKFREAIVRVHPESRLEIVRRLIDQLLRERMKSAKIEVGEAETAPAT